MDLSGMIARQFWRSMNMAERVLLGPLTPEVRAPREVVFQWGKVRLFRYERMGPTRPVPVLIVPPLGVSTTIFDLRAGHSLIGYLAEAGLDVFLLDYGVPDEEELKKSILTYATVDVPRAVERVRGITRSTRVSLVGWSLGGVFIYLYTAWRHRDGCVGNLVTVGSPVDFARMFPFNVMAKLSRGLITQVLEIIGNLPAPLVNNGFKLLNPLGSLKRQVSLVRNYWDREYVAAYESVSQWAGGFLPYPAESLREFAADFIADDKLKMGGIHIDGRPIHLNDIDCPILSFAGTTDKVTSPESVAAIAQLAGSDDITTLYVPLGHIGMVAGSSAPKHVWQPMAEWLLARS